MAGEVCSEPPSPTMSSRLRPCAEARAEPSRWWGGNAPDEFVRCMGVRCRCSHPLPPLSSPLETATIGVGTRPDIPPPLTAPPPNIGVAIRPDMPAIVCIPSAPDWWPAGMWGIVSMAGRRCRGVACCRSPAPENQRTVTHLDHSCRQVFCRFAPRGWWERKEGVRGGHESKREEL